MQKRNMIEQEQDEAIKNHAALLQYKEHKK